MCILEYFSWEDTVWIQLRQNIRKSPRSGRTISFRTSVSSKRQEASRLEKTNETQLEAMLNTDWILHKSRHVSKDIVTSANRAGTWCD